MPLDLLSFLQLIMLGLTMTSCWARCAIHCSKLCNISLISLKIIPLMLVDAVQWLVRSLNSDVKVSTAMWLWSQYQHFGLGFEVQFWHRPHSYTILIDILTSWHAVKRNRKVNSLYVCIINEHQCSLTLVSRENSLKTRQENNFKSDK